VNPRGANQPNVDPALHPAIAPERSLVESLGEIVDEANQIAVDLGERPYRVFSVTYRWTGGAIGRGTSEVYSQTEFLPTPIVSSLTSLVETHTPGGTIERGIVTLTQISPRYTETQLGYLCKGTLECRGPAFETFLEIAMDRRDGTDVARRRFTFEGAPYRDTRDVGWRLQVARQDADRSNDGQPPRLAMHTPYSRGR
jgi:hypothetical protein